MIIFYRNNRTDQAFKITKEELKRKFKQWQEKNPDLKENWPLARQASVFLMNEMGTYDQDSSEEIMEALCNE